MHVLVSSWSSCIRIFYMQSVLHILFPGWLMGADPQPKHLHGVYLWNFRVIFPQKTHSTIEWPKWGISTWSFQKNSSRSPDATETEIWDETDTKKTATGQSKINVTSQTLERLFISLFISLMCNSLQQRKPSERRRLFRRALGDRTFQELINEFSLGDRSVDVQLEDLLAQRKHNGTRKWTRAKGVIGCKKLSDYDCDAKTYTIKACSPTPLKNII